MKKIAIMLMLFINIMTFFALTSCGEGDNPSEEVTIALSRANLDMMVGDEYKLETIISPASHKNDTVEWKSSNSEIASCENGVVKANAVGMAMVTASIRPDVYFSCRINIIEDVENIYMLTSEVISFEHAALSNIDLSAEYISTNEDVVKVINTDDGVMLEAVGEGRAIIKISSEKSAIACREVVVLRQDDLNVDLNIDECLKTVEYNMISYNTSLEIVDVEIQRNINRELLNDGLVEVQLVFKCKKVYDSDGQDAKNPSQFRYEIYSGEKDGLLRSYSVLVNDESVSDGNIIEYTYKFEAVLDDGDGERSFTFKILDSSGK